MGTNYYAVRNRPTVCDPIHIGKSSVGWMFLFHRQNEKWDDPPISWNSFEQVANWLMEHTVITKDFVIMDEYDRIVTYDDFIQMVKAKQELCRDNPDNFRYCQNVDGYRFCDEDFC